MKKYHIFCGLLSIAFFFCGCGISDSFFKCDGDTHRFGEWQKIEDSVYVGRAEFYVNPEKSDVTSSDESQYGFYGGYGRIVMDNMFKLFSSESFIEQMLLDGERLPADKDAFGRVWWTEAENQTYKIEEKLTTAQAAWDAYLEEENDLDAAEKTADEQIEIALAAWRKTDNYKDTLSIYQESLSFSYLQADNEEADADNFAYSFIYVTVCNTDKILAQEIFEEICECLPIYVRENMVVPVGYKSTNCHKTSRQSEVQEKSLYERACLCGNIEKKYE